MMSAEALQDLLVSSFQSQMDNQYTAIPCIVVSVDLASSTVVIQPSINKLAVDGTVSPRPPIQGVPISFQVSKSSGLTFPVNAGDTGIAIFSMRSLEAWKVGNGRPSTPTEYAMMDKADAMFIPGIQPPGVAVNNPAKHVLTHDPLDTVMFANLGGAEAEVRLKANGQIIITTSNQPAIINCSDATVNATNSINLNAQVMTVDVPNMTFIGNITHLGNYVQTGNYTLNSVNINLHKHIGVTTGTGTSGTMV